MHVTRNVILMALGCALNVTLRRVGDRGNVTSAAGDATVVAPADIGGGTAEWS